MYIIEVFLCDFDSHPGQNCADLRPIDKSLDLPAQYMIYKPDSMFPFGLLKHVVHQ
jgi:hypothetical protein